MFLVARGAAKLVVSMPSGQKVTVALRYPGQFVDLSPGGLARTHPFSAVALVSSEIYTIDIAAIQSAQRRSSGLRIQDADLLRSDLDSLVAGFLRSKLQSPVDRLERLLRDLAAALGARDPRGSARLVLPLENAEMASLCGISESYYKAVRQELERSGRAIRESRNVWVLRSD